MTIIIGGSTGISAGLNGTASTPAFQNLSQDTGLFFPAANTAAISTSDTEAMRIDANGNIGLGTTSPNIGYRLHTYGVNPGIGIQTSVTSNPAGNWIDFVNNAGTVQGNIYYEHINNFMSFGTSTGGLRYERLRIDANGNVGIGTSTSSHKLDVGDGTSASQLYVYGNVSGSKNSYVAMQDTSGTSIGFRAVVGGTTTMNLEGGSGNSYFNGGGNLGIGTASPGFKLVSQVTSSTTALCLLTTAAGGGSYVDMIASTYSGAWTVAPPATIRFIDDNSFSAHITFRIKTTGASSNSDVERMRITSGGVLQIGTSSSTNIAGQGSLHIYSGIISFRDTATAAQNWHIVTGDNSNAFNFYNGNYGAGTIKMYIQTNGGIANYSASNTNLSDERVKKEIVLSSNYLDKICSIPVKNFRYIDPGAGERLILGVIAQDVESVAPELVDNSGFGKTPEGKEPLKTIYQTDIMFALMKSIQELNNKLEAALTRIEELESK